MTKITRQKNGYSVISNEALRDNRLSARAKGLYAYIMTLPDDWQIYKEELFKHFTEGRDSLNKAMNELKKIGYMEVVRGHENGRICYEYIIKDQPTEIQDTENQSTVFQGSEKQSTEKPQLLNTDEPITNKTKKSVKKHKHGEYNHVLLSDEEFSRLQEGYGSSLPVMIRNLDEYIETSGKKYKNHSLVLRRWARAEEEKSGKAVAASAATQDVFWKECPDCGRQQRSIGLRDLCPDCGEPGASWRQRRGKEYPEEIL